MADRPKSSARRACSSTTSDANKRMAPARKAEEPTKLRSSSHCCHSLLGPSLDSAPGWMKTATASAQSRPYSSDSHPRSTMSRNQAKRCHPLPTCRVAESHPTLEFPTVQKYQHARATPQRDSSSPDSSAPCQRRCRAKHRARKQHQG